jgi:hypothetical protein
MWTLSTARSPKFRSRDPPSSPPSLLPFVEFSYGGASKANWWVQSDNLTIVTNTKLWPASGYDVAHLMKEQKGLSNPRSLARLVQQVGKPCLIAETQLKDFTRTEEYLTCCITRDLGKICDWRKYNILPGFLDSEVTSQTWRLAGSPCVVGMASFIEMFWMVLPYFHILRKKGKLAFTIVGID